MSVDAISFSAHADYPQTQQFLDALAPPHVVLVHGEAGEMGKLKRALEGKAAADGKKMMVYNPKNCQAVEIKHSQSKTARVVGRLALNPPKEGDRVSGLLVQKDFGHMIVAPEDLPRVHQSQDGEAHAEADGPHDAEAREFRFALEALFEGIHTVSTLGPGLSPSPRRWPRMTRKKKRATRKEEEPRRSLVPHQGDPRQEESRGVPCEGKERRG